MLLLAKVVSTLLSGDSELLGQENGNWVANLSCCCSIQLPGLSEGSGLGMTPL